MMLALAIHVALRILNGMIAGLILGMRPANERGRYFVTRPLIGWAQA